MPRPNAHVKPSAVPVFAHQTSSNTSVMSGWISIGL
jgi:hypothetical protein